MKKLTSIILTVLLLGIAAILINCRRTKIETNPKSDSETTIPANAPLNISVYIDLSDRLIRDLNPSQMERDTAIVNHLIDRFIEDCIKNGKIIDSKNHFQVFFYPAPNSSEIAQLAKGLNVDLSKTELKQKKVKLVEMKDRFQTNLAQIYTDAINDKKWVGSDIWSFFSNGEVDKLCIRKGYRNILVILTDGYLYATNNKIKEGNAYSYILPQTLENPEASLIVERKGLKDLEVLMLEVNPFEPKQGRIMTSVLEKWFNDMEVGNFVVSETAVPVNTEPKIDSFLEN